jgi:branched-chain amino acid aminotransferase
MKRVWFNKELVSGKLALSAQDRGLTLGDGLFETLAVNKGIALWRFEHIERMRKAAVELGIPFPETDIENAIDALTHRSKDHHVLRLTLTRGEGGRGLGGDIAKPTLIGSLQPFDAGLRFQLASLLTSKIRRNLHSPSSRLKTISYVDQILAAREAIAGDADDALMLNTAGRVCCTTIGNIFLELDGALVTPSLSEAVLPGIMRDAVIRLAKNAGISVREKQVKPADLAKADFMFVTNSLRFVRAVTKLDGKRFSARSKLVDKIVQGLLNVEQEQIILN